MGGPTADARVRFFHTYQFTPSHSHLPIHTLSFTAPIHTFSFTPAHSHLPLGLNETGVCGPTADARVRIVRLLEEISQRSTLGESGAYFNLIYLSIYIHMYVYVCIYIYSDRASARGDIAVLYVRRIG